MTRENSLENVDLAWIVIGKLFERKDISYLRQFKSYSEKSEKLEKN